MENVSAFLNKIFILLSNNNIDIENHEIDHLCYRTSSLKNYEATKKKFSKLGKLLVESEVNGRDIATYRLNNPVEYKGFSIPLVEVPAPKMGKTTPDGWEHIEIVTNESFPILIKRFSHLNLKLDALEKKLNPELVIKFEDCSIKFHHQSLASVIEIEKTLL